MTLFNINQYSNLLKDQMQKKIDSFELSSKAPIFHLTHPAILKIDCEEESAPVVTQAHGIHFSILQSTAATYPKGYPYEIWKFLQKPQEVILDFGPIGISRLSPIPIENTVPDKKLALWLNYALSPELWGPEGKWTRFHQTLHGLFTQFDLLLGEDIPGFYPLKKEANRLEKHGFRAEDSVPGVNFILPWDFPLSALSNLEKAVELEF